jgi:hypothetical protein
MADEVVAKKKVPAAVVRRVDKASADFLAAEKARDKAVAKARVVAVAANAAGMSEVELARRFGVDRARTIRRWLGKPN